MYHPLFILVGLLGVSCVAQSQNAPGISNDGSLTIAPSPDDLKNAKSAMPTLTAPPSHKGVTPVVPQESIGEAGGLPRIPVTEKSVSSPAGHHQNTGGNPKN